eukprot:2428324-Prymnesium_polylepis.1
MSRTQSLCRFSGTCAFAHETVKWDLPWLIKDAWTCWHTHTCCLGGVGSVWTPEPGRLVRYTIETALTPFRAPRVQPVLIVPTRSVGAMAAMRRAI